MSQQQEYTLCFILPNGNTEEITLNQQRNKLLVGEAPKCELQITQAGLAPMHALFRFKKGVLTLHMLGPSQSASIGQHALVKGKIYILEPEDQIKLAAVQLSFSQAGQDEEITLEQEVEQQLSRQQDTGPESEEEWEEDDDEEGEESEDDTSEGLDLDIEEIDEKLADQQQQEEEEDDPNEGITLARLIPKSFRRKKKKKEDSPDAEEIGEKTEKSTAIDIEVLRQKAQKEDEDDDDDDDEEYEEYEEEADQGHKEKKGPKKLAIFDNQGPLSGVLSRLLATILDFSIFFVLFYGVKEFSSFLEITTDPLVNFLIPLASNYLPLIESQIQLIPTVGALIYDVISALINPDVLVVFLSFFIFQLLISFILGVTIGAWLMGMTNVGSFLSRRIKGLIRILLTPLTFALIVPELTLIFGKRTLREVLTQDQVSYRKKSLRLFAPVLLFPLAMILTFLLPLAIAHITHPPFNSLTLLESQHRNFGNTEADSSVLLYAPHFSLVVALENERAHHFQDQIILPRLIDPESLGRRGIYSGQRPGIEKMDIYSYQHFERPHQLQLHKNISSLMQWPLMASSGNPLFAFFSPELALFIKNDWGLDPDTELNSVQTEELLQLIKAAQSYHQQDYLELLRKHGPFIGQLLFAHENFVTELDVLPPLTMTWNTRSWQGRQHLPAILELNAPSINNRELHVLSSEHHNLSKWVLTYSRETEAQEVMRWRNLLLNSLPLSHSQTRTFFREAQRSERPFIHFQGAFDMLELIASMQKSYFSDIPPLASQSYERIIDTYIHYLVTNLQAGRENPDKDRERLRAIHNRLLDHLNDFSSLIASYIEQQQQQEAALIQGIEQFHEKISHLLATARRARVEEILKLKSTPPQKTQEYIEERF